MNNYNKVFRCITVVDKRFDTGRMGRAMVAPRVAKTGSGFSHSSKNERFIDFFKPPMINDVLQMKFSQNGKLKTVKASREVILSAGTIRSPQVLLLSGIGPEAHLKEFGIDMVKDLPGVGENFHDHVAISLPFTIDEPDKYDNDWAIATQYLVNQTGPLSSIGLGSVSAVLATEATSPDYPNLQLQFNGYASVCAPGDIGALSSAGKRSGNVFVINLHPKSRGELRTRVDQSV